MKAIPAGAPESQIMLHYDPNKNPVVDARLDQRKKHDCAGVYMKADALVAARVQSRDENTVVPVYT